MMSLSEILSETAQTAKKKSSEKKKEYASWNKESLFQEKGECEEMCMTFLSILTLDNIFVNVVCYMWCDHSGERSETDWGGLTV